MSLLYVLPSNTPSISPLHHLHALESLLSSAISAGGGLPQIKQIHAALLRLGLHGSNFLVSKLIRRLSNLNLPISCYHLPIFSQVPSPNSFLWTSLIRVSPNPFDVYCSMHRHCPRCPPLSFTLTALLKSSECLNLGMQVHAQSIFVGGFDSDLHVQNALIDFYVRCGELGFARKVFDEMLERDLFSGTAMIVAYSNTVLSIYGSTSPVDFLAWFSG